jgi:uncharacterized membrane protein YfcA
VHIDPGVVLAGLIVGFTVGLTGMGGGALMTPILVLLFKVDPLAAVSSDLVNSLVMKPVGGGVHLKRGTVQWGLVKWLVIGSVPSAFAGAFLLDRLGGESFQDQLKLVLGYALLVAAVAMVAKAWLQARSQRRLAAMGVAPNSEPFVTKPIPTMLIGVAGGLIVGLTSVGSGSLMIVLLMLLYPRLTTKSLVGTDLIQAVPLVASAALGHVLFGEVQLGLTTALIIGSLPGVYLGARMSAKAPDGVVRPVLVFVLLASALKLLGMGTTTLGVTLLILVLVALPLAAAVDAALIPGHRWSSAEHKTRWVSLLGIGAPFGIGFVSSIVYLTSVRKRVAPPPPVPEALEPALA